VRDGALDPGPLDVQREFEAHVLDVDAAVAGVVRLVAREWEAAVERAG